MNQNRVRHVYFETVFHGTPCISILAWICGYVSEIHMVRSFDGTRMFPSSFFLFYRCLPLSASDLHTVLSSSRYFFTCESHTFCFLFPLPCLVFRLRPRWFLPLVTKGCKYCTTSVVSKALWFYFILHHRSISW